MRILNTIKKLKVPACPAGRKRQKVKANFKNLTFYFLLLALLPGCIQMRNINQVQDYVSQSENYYQRAIALYKDLIAQGKDLDRLRLELGKLYYNHGEFTQAIEEFKKTNDSQAKKLLAISYYRLSNFTDAL